MCIQSERPHPLPPPLHNPLQAGTMGMAASTIGTVFAIMSAVALVFVQPAAYLSDHVGHKVPTRQPKTAISLAERTLAQDTEQLNPS